jgi:hypothetical protein
VHIGEELLPKVRKVDQVCFITLISSAILSLVVSCTPRLSAIFAIELLSHNLLMATAKPWRCLFLPGGRKFHTQSIENFQADVKESKKRGIPNAKCGGRTLASLRNFVASFTPSVDLTP